MLNNTLKFCTLLIAHVSCVRYATRQILLVRKIFQCSDVISFALLQKRDDYFEHAASKGQDMAVEIISQIGNRQFWQEKQQLI